jgi:hypothetical protein
MRPWEMGTRKWEWRIHVPLSRIEELGCSIGGKQRKMLVYFRISETCSSLEFGGIWE